MLFLELEPVIGCAVIVLLLGTGAFFMRSTYRKSALALGSCALALFIYIAFSTALIADTVATSSQAVISPSGDMAARIVYTDEGPERSASVEVIARHGLSHETVYEARPLLTEKDLHWLDSKNLWLAGMDPAFCRSTNRVSVHCGTSNSPPAPNGPIVLNILINGPAVQAPSLPQDRPSESRSVR